GHLAGHGGDPAPGVGVELLEQLVDHGAVGCLGPTADDPSAEPDRGPDVAHVVEDVRRMRPQIPGALLPPHRSRVETGEEGDGVAGWAVFCAVARAHP